MPFLSFLQPGVDVVSSIKDRGGGDLSIQEVDHQLIGTHHDGGVGNLAYQVGGEATVQSAEALLFGHCF